VWGVTEARATWLEFTWAICVSSIVSHWFVASIRCDTASAGSDGC